MYDIKSLDSLIATLKSADVNDYVKIAKGMNIPASDFSNYVYFKKDGYARNCIIKTDVFELILICWKKNDLTPIHGHDKQKCWVYQVDGQMTEIRYQKDKQDNLNECERIELTPRKLTYMHDSMGYHMLKNASEQNAMTLHLYMNPIDSCEVFNEENDCFEKIDLSFDTIDGKMNTEYLNI